MLTLLLFLLLTFALVGGLVQDGLGGHDFPVPGKTGRHSDTGWKLVFFCCLVLCYIADAVQLLSIHPATPTEAELLYD